MVFGKSGSGKSVLIKCLVGLIDADGGAINLFGRNIESLLEEEINGVRKKIGFLFQSAALQLGCLQVEAYRPLLMPHFDFE